MIMTNSEVVEDWQANFKSYSFKRSFGLHLSQAMIEMLCAVADDCQWDRAEANTIHQPDNWIATQGSLVKRGLIERKCESERAKVYEKVVSGRMRRDEYREHSYYKLTPAGKAVVDLFKVVGVFVPSDAGLRKAARKAVAKASPKKAPAKRSKR
jgi:hypothetical protein